MFFLLKSSNTEACERVVLLLFFALASKSSKLISGYPALLKNQLYIVRSSCLNLASEFNKSILDAEFPIAFNSHSLRAPKVAPLLFRSIRCSSVILLLM